MKTFENNPPKTAAARSKRSTKRVFLRWHRRFGLISSIAVIFLITSGIALNHVESLYKSQAFITSNFLLNWYGVKAPADVFGYQIAAEPLSRDDSLSSTVSDIIWADGTVIINRAPQLFDQQALLGAKTHQDIVYLFTRNVLHLFTLDGQRIESLILSKSVDTYFDEVFNLEAEETSPIEAENLVALKTGEKVQLFNLLKMNFLEEFSNDAKIILHPQNNLKNALLATEQDSQLAREFVLLKSKVLLDFHSGRFFGTFGPVVMDLFAFILLLLVFSGLFMWSKRRH